MTSLRMSIIATEMMPRDDIMDNVSRGHCALENSDVMRHES